VTSSPTGCIGFQFDTLNRMPEGPACVVVAARDKALNTGVSAPLRICIDRGGGKCTGFGASTKADCTGTYDPGAKTVSSTHCTSRTFPASGEIAIYN
jgi:hypothetical protein